MLSIFGKRAWVLLCVCTLGCAAGAAHSRVISAIEHDAYADALQVYRDSGQERALLRAIAETILLHDARLPDSKRSRAAFGELALLGTRARPLLDRLSQAEQPKPVRVRALRLRLSLGDQAAREALRPLLVESDTDVADLAYAALDPARDWPALQRALHAPRVARRTTALLVLASGPAQPNTLQELAEVSRLDPAPAVRAAALGVLERHGPAARSAFERALHDDSESVRIAAIEAFARADPDSAAAALDQQLGGASSAESLSAALALLQMRPARQPARAWDALLRALTASEPALRGRAAVLLRALPGDKRDLEGVRSQLRVEASPEVKLALALALGLEDAAARSALFALMQGTSLPAAQAALELARAGDTSARTRLLALRASTSTLTRGTVARMLGRELHQPQSVALLLADRDPAVRAAAAGAVLAQP
jgi:hypothetical protein